MLLRTLFLLALMAAISETIVYGAASLARAELAHRAVAAARAQFAAAVGREQQTLAQTISAGGAPSAAAPQPIATCVTSTSQGCSLSANTTISPQAAPVVSQTACPNTDCTIYNQSNDIVSEGRLSVQIQTTITAPNGSTLATRSGTVIFRTFKVPPYAVLSGSLDSTLDAIANNGMGDDGGSNSANGTLVNVEYQSTTGKMSGDVWQRDNEQQGSAAPAWDH